MQRNVAPGSRPPRRESLFDVIFGTRKNPPQRTTAPIRRAPHQRPAPRPDGSGGQYDRGDEPGGALADALTRIGRYASIGITVALIAASGWAAFHLLPIGGGDTSPTPSFSAPPAPPGEPLLITPNPSVVASQSITLRGSLPQDLLEKQGSKLRIIVATADGSVMTGAEIELMNLAGPRTGLEMMEPVAQQASTANFFSQGGYYRNSIVREKTAAELLVALDKRTGRR